MICLHAKSFLRPLLVLDELSAENRQSRAWGTCWPGPGQWATCILLARMGPVGGAHAGRSLPFLLGRVWPSLAQYGPDVLLSGVSLLTCFAQGRWLVAVHNQGMSVPGAEGVKALGVM